MQTDFRGRVFATISPLVAGFACLVGLACTAILGPDDMVSRCGTATDCPGTGDNRYVAQCIDGICQANFVSIPCGRAVVEQQGGSEPLKNAYMMYDTPDSYAKCGDETFPFGSQGCPPDNGSCEGNLQPVERGDRTICDDPNALHPAYAFIDSGDLDVIQGQDVADQFCRSFFCDERFVCAYDNQRRNGTCVVCNESGEFGKGGCGTVFSDAAPTCLYTDWCASDPEDIEVGDVQFGC